MYKGPNEVAGMQRKWKERIERKQLKTSLKFHKTKESLLSNFNNYSLVGRSLFLYTNTFRETYFTK